ncbi:MAG: phosphotriesterase family protein [Lachnospiraceae bacterium]|jgi:phosphotriesterase-related protein
MEKMVNTVTGPVSVDKLKRVAMHEHFMFAFPGCQFDIATGKQVQKKEAIDNCIKGAKLLKSLGIDTVVDATPMDCGRNPEWLAEISDKSGLQIICVTGYYMEGFSASGYWAMKMHWAGADGASGQYAELLEAELTHGMDNTDIKAGVIKVATGHNKISDYQKMMIKGASMAHKNTGCPIYTHTEDGELAFDQAKLFLKFGCDASKVVIGHMCGEIRADYHKHILDWGFNTGFDRLGAYDGYHPEDTEKCTCLSKLIKEGYGDRIVVSQDVIYQRLGRVDPYPDFEVHEWRNYRFGYMLDTLFPRLKNEFGVTDEDIDRLLIDNPHKIFS